MIPSSRRVALLLVLALFLGCAVPSPASPPLTVAAVQSLVDGWNPSYCKVTEFYGFYTPGERSNARVAYMLIANPSDPAQKPVVYEARLQLLATPTGGEKWFLVSLVSHSQGLTRRQGWDNLMVQVKEAPAAAAR